MWSRSSSRSITLRLKEINDISPKIPTLPMKYGGLLYVVSICK